MRLPMQEITSVNISTPMPDSATVSIHVMVFNGLSVESPSVEKRQRYRHPKSDRQ